MSSSVYAILVNYHAADLTLRCINSIYLQTAPPTAIFVIDNKATEKSKSIFQHASANAKIPLTFIFNEKNIGFAAACNQAMKAIEDQGFNGYFWLVNNDTVADQNALKELLEEAERTNAGITGSRIELPGNRQGGSATIHPFWGTVKRSSVFRNSPNEYIEGASFLISPECFQKIGFFPEDYFLYSEETDYCYAARRAGFSLALAEKSIIKHKAGNSTGSELGKGKVPFFIDCLLIRNRVFLCRKYGFPKVGIFLALLFSLLLRAQRRQWKRIITILCITLSVQKFKNFIRDNGGSI